MQNVQYFVLSWAWFESNINTNFHFFKFTNLREREKKGGTEEIALLFQLLVHSLAVSCMCRDWGWNTQPWPIRMMPQPTELASQGSTQTFFHCFRERGREREEHRCEREASTGRLPYTTIPGIVCTPAEDWTCSWDVCPDWVLNNLSVMGDAPTNWATLARAQYKLLI